jgi:hypothetical protein
MTHSLQTLAGIGFGRRGFSPRTVEANYPDFTYRREAHNAVKISSSSSAFRRAGAESTTLSALGSSGQPSADFVDMRSFVTRSRRAARPALNGRQGENGDHQESLRPLVKILPSFAVLQRRCRPSSSFLNVTPLNQD